MKELKDRALEARRIWEARELDGEDNRSAFARAINRSPQAVQLIEDGETKTLRGETLAAYERVSGFTTSYLIHGKGPKFPPTPNEETPGGYVAVPVRNAKASAGHAVQNGDIAEIGSILFRPRSMAKKGINTEQAEVWYVTGASMFPRLREGDAVLFDKADTSPILDGKLYVIEWAGSPYVKRLYSELDGAIRVVSDNPAPEFRDRLVQPTDVGFRVIGRVRWIGSWEE